MRYQAAHSRFSYSTNKTRLRFPPIMLTPWKISPKNFLQIFTKKTNLQMKSSRKQSLVQKDFTFRLLKLFSDLGGYPLDSKKLPQLFPAENSLCKFTSWVLKCETPFHLLRFLQVFFLYLFHFNIDGEKIKFVTVMLLMLRAAVSILGIIIVTQIFGDTKVFSSIAYNYAKMWETTGN